MKKFDMVIYHGNCADGFTAAWIAADVLGTNNTEFVAGVYGKAPPDVTDKHVLMLDFSYKRDVLTGLATSAKSITILDHHKSAAADLADFIRPLADPDKFVEHVEFEGIYPIQAEFDMERSGAMMTWNYFYPESKAPSLVAYIQDHDLWRFALLNSREISAWVFSHDYDFETWDELDIELRRPEGRAGAAAQGYAINRKHDKDIRELLAANTFEVVIGKHVVKVANLPYTMASDAAHILAHDRPFGATFFLNADGKYIWSFRSTDGGVDVSEVAAAYGGGGHAQASGCQTSIMFPRYHAAPVEDDNSSSR